MSPSPDSMLGHTSQFDFKQDGQNLYFRKSQQTAVTLFPALGLLVHFDPVQPTVYGTVPSWKKRKLGTLFCPTAMQFLLSF